ncbi:lysylphosphatidylglycerol synthase transmembrane domain-containing protein [Terriglobus tenax]|uniref:lysylphosphatidylglycerol synthase transmembrane domain-containing protein n=1 Tax=Terriglobus tenax TaxID=1111115 RepID=UPI0021E01EBB|nr:lysylphosphatidylglycerol synthase transmembrane domain-containing protein [Terriglobus tenax]
MKDKKTPLALAVIAILAVLVFVFRSKIHFDFALFVRQLGLIDYRHIAAGCGLIWATYLCRSWRWSILLKKIRKVSPLSLTGSQFIGFTAVAIFGRLADLSRPYIVAKRTRTQIAPQIAIYTLERMFDLGAAAMVFSTALLFLPRDMPNRGIFLRVGAFSLAATLAIAIFAIAIRLAGPALAALARAILGKLSDGLGEAVAHKILGFREGMMAIPSLSSLVVTVLISLLMWTMIAGAYLQTAHAFVQTPELATLSFASIMLLMAASLGGSLLQLPIIGWFTQIAATAAAMQAIYKAPIEAATACGALLLIVTSLSIILPGLVFARIEHVSIGKVAEESEHVAEASA